MAQTTARGRRRVDRIGPSDLVQLATDVGPVPMNVAAVLLLDAGGAPDAVGAELATRLAAVAPLRRRLVSPPWWLGRPYWVRDERFRVGDHLEEVACDGDGDLARVLELAVEAVTRPVDRSRPPWRALVLTGLAGGQAAVVLVLHHVLADGIGGLAVLGALVDGAPAPRPAVEQPAPTKADLVLDALAERARTIRGVPGRLRRVRRGRAELGDRRGAGAPRTSLNAPTGPRRAVGVVEVELAPLRAAGRARGATVNDVLLVATSGALARVLRARGEDPAALVVSVPVSARRSTTSADLGNQVGVMPVRCPVTGSAGARLSQVARSTARQKGPARGASAALIGPAFRALSAVGLFRWFVERQRLVNSFLTNLPGPAARVAVAGAEVRQIVPITITAGNVGVAFAAFSYAGRLTVTVIVDPDLVPDPGLVAAALETELAALAAG